MAPGPQNEFSHFFRRVVAQFQMYVATAENLALVGEDQNDIGALFVEIGTVKGNVNTLLQQHSELLIRAGWFHAKYAGFLSDISRESTVHFNLVYSGKRDHGFGEWDAKRIAETDKAYLEIMTRRSRLERLVNILKVLVDACKERLTALQQISNNYRAELRDAQL